MEYVWVIIIMISTLLVDSIALAVMPGSLHPSMYIKKVAALVDDNSIQLDPWLARQNCANAGCHGHINTDPEKRAIDNAKPDCRLCHGIHNLSHIKLFQLYNNKKPPQTEGDFLFCILPLW
jgi:hypothetical protein